MRNQTIVEHGAAEMARTPLRRDSSSRAALVALGLLSVACTMPTADPDADGGAGSGAGVGASGQCGVGGAGSTLMCPGGLPCAHLVLPEQECAFTEQQALGGIDIAYQVVIDESVPDVTPEPLDQGACAQPGPSGLIVFEELKSTTGGNEHYCQCDIGSCPPSPPAAVSLVPGVYDRTFHWTGRSFEGPGDGGVGLGDPFGKGLYVLSLRAIGTQELEGTQPFEIGATMTLRVE